MKKEQELLKIEGLKTYFNTSEGFIRAVDEINLKINKGEILGVVGESGCGKTTLALSIIRLVPSPLGEIKEGKIFFEGKNLLDLDNDEMRKIRGGDIAIAFQDPTSYLNPLFTIGDQIGEAIKIHQNLDKLKIFKSIRDILEKVGISDPEKMIRSYPHEFSGGMKQRAMIAMALSCRPKLLILDEPTSSLDVTIQAQILELIENLKEELGFSILLITHNLAIIAQMSEKVAVMYAGKILEYGTVMQIFMKPKHPYTQGLLLSIPSIDVYVDRLKGIGGEVPSLVTPPSGCKFHPRCKYVASVCEKVEPKLINIGGDHMVACHKV